MSKKPALLTLAAMSATGVFLIASPCHGQLGSATSPSTDQPSTPGSNETRRKSWHFPPEIGLERDPSSPAQSKPDKSENIADIPQATAGPLQEKRQALLAKIYQAKGQGIGITSYLAAFNFLEDLAKAGGDPTNLEKRIASLDNSLEEQFKRGALLKVQKLVPTNPGGANAGPGAAPPGTNMNMMGPGPMAGNSDPASLIQKLQNKFGGQIPADLQAKYGNKIPDSLKSKLGNLNGLGSDPSQLLQNDKVKELLKNLKK